MDEKRERWDTQRNCDSAREDRRIHGDAPTAAEPDPSSCGASTVPLSIESHLPASPGERLR